MRAVLCKEFGPPEKLVVEEVPSPAAGKGEVRIDVHAAAVNFPDLLIIQNKYQFKPPLPFSPGGEVAGVVREVGAGVTALKPGDRVLATTMWGGFAEEVAVDESRVAPIPDAMDFATAAAFFMAYGTSHHALVDRAHLKAGETLVVLGAAGGVGLAAVEIGKVLGARVIACASADDKLEVCKEHGADAVINYAREDLKERMKELTRGSGADVVYDPVGGQLSEAALRSTAWEGRFLVVGFAGGDIPRIPLNLVLLKGCQIVGVFWGSFIAREPEKNRANLAELVRWFEEKKIRPHISETFPLERAADALNAMAARKVKGKVVLVTGKS
ncbi:MAG TPA: NADPH:quinone oxidoreductase family protein [Polyangiaceae bacterium]|nr:NADPH:quinone oxidoreductase family protein [Polyangiaceae bacterium]